MAETPTEHLLVETWSEVLEHSDFDLSDDFFDVGGDSLQAMTMLTAIEVKTGVRVPMESLILDGATVVSLSQIIDGDTGKDAISKSVVTIKRGSDLPPLFATHVAGGHLSDYLQLGLHPRGMDSSEPADSSIRKMAEHCVAAVTAQQPDGPYRLIGFSFGARLAYELAQVLSEQGRQVSHLIMLDPVLPGGDKLRHVKAVYRGWRDKSPSVGMHRLVNLVPASLGLRAAPNSLDAAHFVANLAYRAKPFVAQNSPPKTLMMSRDQNAQATQIAREWRQPIGPCFQHDLHPGDHLGMINGNNAFSLAR
jgi:thioesterase domain-containing protein/acyl carrier protein